MTCEELEEFFTKYQGLRLDHIATLSNKTINEVIALQNKYEACKNLILDESIWHNKEWFVKKYVEEKVGIISIAKMIGHSPSYVYSRLDEYGISSRPNKSTEFPKDAKFKDELWLREHYCTREEYIEWCSIRSIIPEQGGGKGLTLKECADICGTSSALVSYWLKRHSIRIRNRSEDTVIKQKRKAQAEKSRGGETTS